MCVPILQIHRQAGTVTHVGGSTSDGSPWGLTVDEAAAMIDSQQWDFFVEVPVGSRIPVMAKTSPSGNRYLTTSPDGIKPNNLESLPDLPLPLAGVIPPFPLSVPGTSVVGQASIQDVEYRYKPAATFLAPDPDWKDEHKGPFTNGKHDLALPKVFWSSGAHMFRMAAVLPYPASYTLTELLIFGTSATLRPVERVLGSDIGRRQALEAQGQGWWSWDLVVTKPDGTIDHSKPSRLTEVRIAYHPSDSAWNHKDFVISLEIRGVNANCSAYASVNLHAFTVPKVAPPPPPKCTLPDVVGMRLDKAFIALDACHLNIYTIGSTSIDATLSKVAAQSVTAGTLVEEHSELILRVEPVTAAATGVKQLQVTNESDRMRGLDLWLFDYTSGGWAKKGTVALHATTTVALTDKHSQLLAAIDTTDAACQALGGSQTTLPLVCIAWREAGPRMGATSGPTVPLTIT